MNVTERSTTHDTFVIERTFDATPARVFTAFSDPVAKFKWFGGPDEWPKEGEEYKLDFRIGGHELYRGGPAGHSIKYDATIHNIVPGERIVTAYTMEINDRPMSISIATVELRPQGDKTYMKFTEQGAFFDGLDDVKQREQGTRDLMDSLAASLKDDA